MRTAIRKRLEAMEMWWWRMIMKIPKTARKKNEAVMGIVWEKKEMIRIVRRQLKF